MCLTLFKIFFLFLTLVSDILCHWGYLYFFTKISKFFLWSWGTTLKSYFLCIFISTLILFDYLAFIISLFIQWLRSVKICKYIQPVVLGWYVKPTSVPNSRRLSIFGIWTVKIIPVDDALLGLPYTFVLLPKTNMCNAQILREKLGEIFQCQKMRAQKLFQCQGPILHISLISPNLIVRANAASLLSVDDFFTV